MLNKQDATKIRKKLRARRKVPASKHHDYYEFFVDGKAVVNFGIRRSPKKDQGHGHLPKDLFLTQQETVRLAACTLSKDDYVEYLRKEGHV